MFEQYLFNKKIYPLNEIYFGKTEILLSIERLLDYYIEYIKSGKQQSAKRSA